MKDKLEIGTLMSGQKFTLPLDLVTRTLAIIAIRGWGKTVAATVIDEEMCEAGLPWVAIDPVGVWWGLRANPDGSPILACGSRIARIGVCGPGPLVTSGDDCPALIAPSDGGGRGMSAAFALQPSGPPAPCSFPRCTRDAFHDGDHNIGPAAESQKNDKRLAFPGPHYFRCAICGVKVVEYGDPAHPPSRICDELECALELSRRFPPRPAVVSIPEDDRAA